VDRWRRVDLAAPAPAAAAASGNGTPVDDLLWPQALPSLFDEPAFAAAARTAGTDVAELRRALQAFAGVREREAHVREARRLLPVLQAIAAELPGDATRAGRRLLRRIDALQRVVRIGSGVVVEAWPERDELPRGSEGTMWIAVHTTAGEADRKSTRLNSSHVKNS